MAKARTLQAATAADARHIAARFAGRPGARALFDELCDHMARQGPMELVATKSRVSFLAGTRFAWVPEAFVDGSIFVRFLLPHPLTGARWRSALVGSRWSHGTKTYAIDDELKGRLAEAYAFDREAIRDAKPRAKPRNPRNPRKRVSPASADSVARRRRRAA